MGISPRRNRIGLALALSTAAVAVSGLFAAQALATNHLIKIREVYAGQTGHLGDDYVELQLYANGQNFLQNVTSLKLYDADGNVTENFQPTMNPPNGQTQRRILFATSSAQTTFSKTAGYTLPAGNNIKDAGGAVCYLPSSLSFTDCVSWGNFNNTSGTPLPSTTGGNVDTGGIPDGSAIRRSIAPHCSTLLEPSDDTNDPADWSDATPAPLNNADTPPESSCPQARITSGPSGNTTDRTPTFRFTSSVQPPGGFQCKIDDKPFEACTSPDTLARQPLGRHVFKVRAKGGNSITTPDSQSFKVVRQH